MIVIKRYSNRKLYDTTRKKYISLEVLAEMIRNGEDIKVIDNNSGEDLTTLTLTQLVFEQQKKRKGFLPHSILAGMLRSGEERWSVLQRSIVSSKFFTDLINDEITHRIQTLVKDGDLSMKEGQILTEKILQTNDLNSERQINVQALPELDRESIDEFISTRSIPTQEDLSRLSEQIGALADKIEDMSSNSG